MGNISKYARSIDELSPSEIKDMEVIDLFLNHYELISIGISQGILDKSTYKKWMKTTFINDWNTVKKYISDVRKIGPRHERNFVEYQALATEWGGDPLPE